MALQAAAIEGTKRTEAIEDYLKSIYKLQQDEDRVTTSAIAVRMRVSPASVTSMVKRLAEMNLLTHAPYHGVELTQAGVRIALEIIRHHRLIELYLANALGFGWDAVDAEAEKLEHVISEEFEAKISEVLGHPTLDPHGASIPTREGEIDRIRYLPLTAVRPGGQAIVRQVSDRDPAMLRYLARIDLHLGNILEVVERSPVNGPLVIRIATAQHILSQELASRIYVTVLETP